MNRRLKRHMKKAFEAPQPDPQEKERLLRMLPRSRIRMLQFIWIQAAYLRKWTFFLSILFLLPVLMDAYCVKWDILWAVSSFVPFLGLLAVAESKRSMLYGMSEFEMSSQFSLKSVVLARMSILGILDVFILCCFIPFCCINNNFTVLQTGIYLFVPYLLTVNISLWTTRHFHGKETVYACASVAVLVCVANTGLHIMADFVYQFSYVKWWLMLSALLMGAMIYETYRTIKQTEELAWSL